jgi:integrase
MTTMGAHGEGGIARRKDGRLSVRITMPSGRRIERTVPAMKDGRAQRRLAGRLLAELVEARRADLEPASQTLAVYLRSWLAGLRDARHARVRPRTLEFYSMIVEQHIIPALGGHRLERLSERHVQAWLDADPGAPRSIHHHRAVLRRALNVAVRQRILARNPAIAVELPELDEFAGEPLTIAEARQLLEATSGERLGALWRLALVTGLRSSELTGLAWDDVDLDAGAVTVRAQLARLDGAWVRVPPKPGRTLARISIDPATVAALRAHQRRLVEERRPEWRFWGLVFVTAGGQPWGRSEILRQFHAACDSAGVWRRRLHDLRVSAATLLQELGVEEPVRMARLGHTTTRMARHYAIARDELDRDAATKLGEAIG